MRVLPWKENYSSKAKTKNLRNARHTSKYCTEEQVTKRHKVTVTVTIENASKCLLLHQLHQVHQKIKNPLLQTIDIHIDTYNTCHTKNTINTKNQHLRTEPQEPLHGIRQKRRRQTTVQNILLLIHVFYTMHPWEKNVRKARFNLWR